MAVRRQPEHEGDAELTIGPAEAGPHITQVLDLDRCGGRL
jgi:hypothetical protein